jgi:6-phosphogluconolactonase
LIVMEEFMPAPPEIDIQPDAHTLANGVASRLVGTLAAALTVRPVAHLVLTGGGILERTLRALQAMPAHETVNWQRIHLWWGDERYVPAGSPDRNDAVAAVTDLLAALAFEPAHLHPMPASDGPAGEDVDAAARSYAETLAEAAPAGADVPAFDVILLGVGPDGHCASLFPGHPGTREKDASVIAVRDSPKPPPTRISLTFRALDAANEVWFVVSGSGKADAVRSAFSGADRERVPSAGPRGRHRTLWLLDRAAAADLPAGLATR